MSATNGATTEQRPDPSGVQAAIDRYRDLAKYLIGIFAAIGGLLLAGTQLASVGSLSWDDEPGRVVATALGLLAALVAVACVLAAALQVLRPVEMSLEQVIADTTLRREIDARPSLLGDASSVRNLRDRLTSTLISDDEHDVYAELALDVVDYAAYLTTRKRFNRVWPRMLGAAVLGAAGIIAFAWGANPPKDAKTPTQVVRPQPVVVRVSLVEDGRAALRSAIGAACARRAFRALSIGGTEAAPRLVTLPEHGCRPAQFLLEPAWGHTRSTERAPGD